MGPSRAESIPGARQAIRPHSRPRTGLCCGGLGPASLESQAAGQGAGALGLLALGQAEFPRERAWHNGSIVRAWFPHPALRMTQSAACMLGAR